MKLHRCYFKCCLPVSCIVIPHNFVWFVEVCDKTTYYKQRSSIFKRAAVYKVKKNKVYCRWSNKFHFQSPGLTWCFNTRKCEKENFFFHKTLRMTQRPFPYLLKPEALKLFEFSTHMNFKNTQFMVLYALVFLHCLRYECIILNLNTLPIIGLEPRLSFII
jgi:hypothetical protein